MKLNFRVKSGVLYYYASSVSAEERRWRRVITAEEERHRVITSASCHAYLLKVSIAVIYVGAVTRMAAIYSRKDPLNTVNVFKRKVYG